ncbi:hypothetical protein MNBD_NITROSPINAE02-91 [hydrothermal vent metagenome]|uniref:J domain-containing protein n=1 Tax=hydrothermal vent metagenome TaxID=652676 RepID=A0A3B1CH61_9ZZZZ
MKRKRVGDLNHFQILNIHSSATDEAIGQAYLTLTSVYGDGSIATYGALDKEEKGWMLKRIQEAYDTLMEPQKKKEYISGLDFDEETEDTEAPGQSPDFREPIKSLKETSSTSDKTNGDIKRAHLATSDEMASPFTPPEARITGEHLRNVRMAKGASLEEIASITKVKRSYLEALEMDDFAAFPAPVFMKGFLKSYAKALGLNPEEISSKYFAKD